MLCCQKGQLSLSDNGRASGVTVRATIEQDTSAGAFHKKSRDISPALFVIFPLPSGEMIANTGADAPIFLQHGANCAKSLFEFGAWFSARMSRLSSPHDLPAKCAAVFCVKALYFCQVMCYNDMKRNNPLS